MICNHKHPYRQIIKKIEESGYETGTISMREYPDELHRHDSLGIFDASKKVVKDDVYHFYGVRFPRVLGRERVLSVGNLWLENEARNAKFHERWVLEVYGKEYLAGLKSTVEKISRKYRAEVYTVLVSNKPSLETFLSDHPGLF